MEKNILWFKGLVAELSLVQDSVKMFCDSQSTIHLSKNQAYYKIKKHIDVGFKFIGDEIAKGWRKFILRKMQPMC